MLKRKYATKITAVALAAVMAFGAVPAGLSEISVNAEEMQAAVLTDAEAVEKDSKDLKINNLEDVRGNLTLPLIGENATQITWSSSNPAVISDKASGTKGEIPAGIVNRPQKDTTVKLTATISKGKEKRRLHLMQM